MKQMLGLVLAVVVLIIAVRVVISADEDTYLSEDIQRYCEEIGGDYGICVELLEAIIERESRGQADVVSADGTCKGLMQINQKYHVERMKRLGVEDIFNPYGNILVGADYLYELFEKHEDVGVVLMLYHGEWNALEKGSCGKLSEYADSILKRSAELEEIHERREAECQQ